MLAAALATLAGDEGPAGAAPPPTCNIANVTPLNFGVYRSGTANPVDSTGQLEVTCSGAVAVQIQMGRGPSGRAHPREARSRSSHLLYDVYLDAAHTTVWGDGTGGTQALRTMTTMGQPLVLPFYGRVFPFQGVARGVYSDQVPVVVLF